MSTVLTLPTQPIAPTRVDPRISIWYGIPKIGKTTECAKLPGAMILDLERGTEMIEALKIPISSISGGTAMNEDGSIKFTSLDAVYDAIIAKGTEEYKATGKTPKPPYKFLVVDTIDKLEDYCIVTATQKYKASTLGKNFEGKSVLELPQGGGYYHLRNEVVEQIERLAGICEYLLLISHIRDKTINKGGVDVSVNDISLTGRLGQIVCAKADVIGYMYREPGKTGLQVSFETFENTPAMGARVPRLAGKRMTLDWTEIFSHLKEKAA